ncbi:hypothetical protein HK104_010002 [Borealophlyctis nickersoniae]|nr:hypothetical protein HK104_010002 [Borealophlyctis nickersoniae]
MKFENLSYFWVTLERHNEEYLIRPPNFQIKGLLVGNLYTDFGGSQTVFECPQTGLAATLTFSQKGFFALGKGGPFTGKIVKNLADESSREDQILCTFAGDWRGRTEVVNCQTKDKRILLDMSKIEHVPPTPVFLPGSEELHSKTIWASVTRFMELHDHGRANAAKRVVETRQRELETERDEGGLAWAPQLFRLEPAEGRGIGIKPVLLTSNILNAKEL